MIPRMRLRALLVLSVAAMLTSSCMASGQLTRQHEPTEVSTLPPPVDPRSPGYKQALPFARYVAWAREQIRTARQRAGLSGPDEQAIVDMRAPFEWEPDPVDCRADPGRARRGILLIHGLTDSPFLMRDVGRHFEKRCFLVRAILLPGHGTVPGDLLDATYQEWVAATRYGIDGFANQVDDLYVAGFSTGGALAVYHALRPDELRHAIKALMLISPAIKVASPLVPLANWHKIYSWAMPRGRWDGNLYDERDAAKYESFPKNGGDQVYLLTLDIADRLRSRPLDTPVFIALSRDDGTVNSRATIEFFNAITPAGTSSANALIAYTRSPDALGDQFPIRNRDSVWVGAGIVSSSHVAIPIRPDNPHYGREGTYKSCLAYEPPNNRPSDPSPESALTRCRRGRPPGDGVRLGETSLRQDLDDASAHERLEPPLVLRRLTFNPDFDGLMAEVDAFVQRVEADAPARAR
jgi:esterase/lipase